MDKIRRYLQAAAKKVAEKSEKPLTLITTMAFLFACMVLLPLAGFPVIADLLISAAIAFVTLLLVLIVVHAHGRDLRTLRTRLDQFAAELETISQARAEQLSPAEVQRIRSLIAEQASGSGDDDVRRANRDKRPSLF